VADPITNERLQKIADVFWVPCCTDNELHQMARELLDARARIKDLEAAVVRDMTKAMKRLPDMADPNTRCVPDPIMAQLAMVTHERDALRADLRKAVELIRLTCAGFDSPEWKEQAADLLHRHKEPKP
jgi:hypothetical protein